MGHNHCRKLFSDEFQLSRYRGSFCKSYVYQCLTFNDLCCELPYLLIKLEDGIVKQFAINNRIRGVSVYINKVNPDVYLSSVLYSNSDIGSPRSQILLIFPKRWCSSIGDADYMTCLRGGSLYCQSVEDQRLEHYIRTIN